jgi:hypothetical protein
LVTRRRILGTAAGIVAGVLLVAGGGLRLSRTPEWTVLLGGENERQVICRSVYKKSVRRASWCLERLLRDSSAAVRVTAIGALACREDLDAHFIPRLRALAVDPDSGVRAAALEWLCQRGGMAPRQWLVLARSELADAGSRERHPQLLFVYLAKACEQADEEAIAWALGLLPDPAFAAGGALQGLLRHPRLLAAHREQLAAAHATASRSSRLFIVAALTAIDGVLPDSQEATAEPAAGLVRFTVEAEWAQRIDPNFQIDMQEGELGILLGEGAGGDHFWRRHEYSTVDIGKAFYTFLLSREDSYQIWCRCWFSDKCGNHSLLHVDDRWLQWRDAGHDDQADRLRVWHWKRIETAVRLAAGRHTLTLTAGDDGLLYDKLAVLPTGERFDPEAPPPLAGLYDTTVPTGISLTAEHQSQSRGTSQTVTAWVRRNSPALARGSLSLALPPPFVLASPATVDLEFAAQSPLASAAFLVELPAAAVGGEVEAEVTFQAEGSQPATGAMVLGVTWDWYTTGPLDPRSARAKALQQKTALQPEDLREGWQRFPEAGYDRYRRLDFEAAYGQQQNKVIFLYTELDSARAGGYLSLLTLDDSGWVFLDGHRVAGRSQPDVGEGWLMVDKVTLTPGRHRVFAWVYQADFPEPVGADAGRHTPNHWVFKWLLREALHRASPDIRSLPVDAAGQ